MALFGVPWPSQQVAHAHRSEVVRRRRRCLLRKEAQHLVVERELSFGDCETHCRGREALAQRVHHVRRRRFVRRPPAFRHHSAVSYDHDAVHAIDRAVGGRDEAEDCGRGNAFAFGSAADESRGGVGMRVPARRHGSSPARTTSTPRNCVDWKACMPQDAARRTRQQLLDVGANKSAQSAARVEREVAFRPRIV